MTLADHPGCILPRSTEIQPFGATRAAYGQNRRDFSGYFSSPQDLPRAILVGSNDTKQINMNVSHPHPTEIHPFGATNSTNSQNCLIILGLFFAIMVFKLAKKKCDLKAATSYLLWWWKCSRYKHTVSFSSKTRSHVLISIRSPIIGLLSYMYWPNSTENPERMSSLDRSFSE